MPSFPLRPIALALLVAACGCVAAPPIRASGGLGGSAGSVPGYSSDGHLHAHEIASSSSVRVTATPLSLMRAPLERAWDVGVGWTADWIVTDHHQPLFLHGPVAEVAWFAQTETAPSSPFRWRWGPFATAELFLDQRAADDDQRGQGFGGSAGARFESVMDATHTGRMSASRGELGFGVSARAGVRHVDGETHGVVLFAVELRFPGFIGVHLPVLDARAAAGAPR